MTDFRALCAELLDEFVYHTDWSDAEELKDRARAALADGPAVPDGREPDSVVREPSDEDLLGIACQSIEPYDKIRPGEYEAENECAIEVYGSELVTFARAVLARWGNPAPQPPAEGEVAELVVELRMMASQAAEACQFTDAENLSRAADLLQRGQSALHRLHRLQQENARFREPERTILCDILANGTLLPDPDGKRYGVQPVPVSERLPGPEDCDAEWRCWWAHETDKDIGIAGKWVLLRFRGKATVYTHWLPVHALPIPQQQENING